MQSDIQNNPGVIQAGAPELALQQQRVLRNTYLLLALTMVPTAIGAFIGVRTGGIIMQYPIVSFFVMLGRGYRAAVRHRRQPQQQPRRRAAARDDLHPGLVARPAALHRAHAQERPATDRHGCRRHRRHLLRHGRHRDHREAGLQLHGQVSVRRHDRGAARHHRQHVPADPGARADDLGDRGGDLLRCSCCTT